MLGCYEGVSKGGAGFWKRDLIIKELTDFCREVVSGYSVAAACSI